MDSIVKYKLSNYKEIRLLSENKRVVLCYDIVNDRTCVKKYTDMSSADIYRKLMYLKSEFLPKIYEVFNYDNNYIIIEEYIKGKSVENIVKEKGIISEPAAVKYISDISNALKLIHSINIIHRDISPDNVIIDNKDSAVLLDFDIARQGNKNKSTDTTILGTAGFASPEQFGFAQTDVRSDIYSLGVLLNYMLTGRIVQMGVYSNEPLKSVIVKATRIDPDLRYMNISEFERNIKSIFNEQRKTGYAYRKETIDKEPYYNKFSKADLGLFPLPGFRTNNIIKKIIAVFFYVFWIVWIIAMFGTYGLTADALIWDFFYLIIYIYPIWWFGNNGKQWNIIPGIKNRSYGFRLLMAILTYFAILMIFCVNMPLPEAI